MSGGHPGLSDQNSGVRRVMNTLPWAVLAITIFLANSVSGDDSSGGESSSSSSPAFFNRISKAFNRVTKRSLIDSANDDNDDDDDDDDNMCLNCVVKDSYGKGDVYNMECVRAKSCEDNDDDDDDDDDDQEEGGASFSRKRRGLYMDKRKPGERFGRSSLRQRIGKRDIADWTNRVTKKDQEYLPVMPMPDLSFYRWFGHLKSLEDREVKRGSGLSPFRLKKELSPYRLRR